MNGSCWWPTGAEARGASPSKGGQEGCQKASGAGDPGPGGFQRHPGHGPVSQSDHLLGAENLVIILNAGTRSGCLEEDRVVCCDV